MDWVRPAIGMTTDYEVAGWASAKFGYVAWTGELRVQPGNESGAHITEWAEKARRPSERASERGSDIPTSRRRRRR